MLNGPLYQEEDDDNSGGAGQAAGNAADSFPDSPAGAVTSCTPAPGTGAGSGSGAAAPAWTQADIKSNLDRCDGGTNVWAKGKAGNGGNEPTISEGTSVIGTGASVLGGAISIDPGKTKCQAKQYAVQELSNMGHNPDFDTVRGHDCTSGNLGRDDFIRANERLEFDGVQNVNKAFDACKASWGCGATATSIMDGFRNKTFDQYYAALWQGHKDYYGNMWDRTCKTYWDARHTPAPAPGATPPAPPPPRTPSPLPDDSDADGSDGA